LVGAAQGEVPQRGDRSPGPEPLSAMPASVR